MRKLVLALLSISLIASCSPTKEKKAQKLITQQLKETLNDWSTYESVKFGTLDSSFTTLGDDSMYLSTCLKYEFLKGKCIEVVKEMEEYSGMTSEYYRDKCNLAHTTAQMYLDSSMVYLTTMDSMINHFIPSFNGWSMTHSFRANNGMGNKVIGHFKYYFDPEVTIIKKSEDIGEK